MSRTHLMTMKPGAIMVLGILILLSAGMLGSNLAAAGAGVAEPPIPVGEADSRAEHEQLAKYFEQQAQTEIQRLAMHEKMLDQYKEVEKSLRTLPLGQVGTGTLSRARHCELLVENTRRNVEAYQGLMQHHQTLAEKSTK